VSANSFFLYVLFGLVIASALTAPYRIYARAREGPDSSSKRSGGSSGDQKEHDSPLSHALGDNRRDDLSTQRSKRVRLQGVNERELRGSGHVRQRTQHRGL
jgi:hypothetical protein